MTADNTTTNCTTGVLSRDCPEICSGQWDGIPGQTFKSDWDWYHFLLSSIGTWLVAALVVLIPRLIYAPLKVSYYFKSKILYIYIYFYNLVVLYVSLIFNELFVLQSRQEEEQADEKLLTEPSLYSNIQNWAGEMISGSTSSGRVLVCFSFLCSMLAMCIYIRGKVVLMYK